MKKLLPLLFLMLFISSCAETVQEKKESEEEEYSEIEQSPESENPVSEEESVDVAINQEGDFKWIKVKYKDVTIAIAEFELNWPDKYSFGSRNDSVYKPKSDTAYLDLFPGVSADALPFRIENSEYDEIELFEKIVYHVSMDSKRDMEVPVCIMTDWKKFESKWNRIKLDPTNPMFNTNQANVKPLINFTKDEFLSAVDKHCGNDWLNEIKSISSVEKMPSAIFLSYRLFKVVLRNSKTGKTKEKFIQFYTPTSC
ncbi:MAG: hypothetical protein NWQ27_05140 [Crocinitomicaceae bacterium]|jgi:hypothetical protein|nr:hypothetical protein [Crocinitomicaceae bacterium]